MAKLVRAEQLRSFDFTYQNRPWKATLWKNSEGMPAQFWDVVPKTVSLPDYAEYNAARRYLERLVA